MPETTRLWVGGLASSLSEEDLRRRFTPFGQVKTVEVVRERPHAGASEPSSRRESRGFAYVELQASTEEKLQECLKVYRQTAWMGRKLRVRLAEPSAMERLRQEQFENRQKIRERRHRERRIRQLSGDWGRTVDLVVSQDPKVSRIRSKPIDQLLLEQLAATHKQQRPTKASSSAAAPPASLDGDSRSPLQRAAAHPFAAGSDRMQGDSAEDQDDYDMLSDVEAGVSSFPRGPGADGGSRVHSFGSSEDEAGDRAENLGDTAEESGDGGDEEDDDAAGVRFWDSQSLAVAGPKKLCKAMASVDRSPGPRGGAVSDSDSDPGSDSDVGIRFWAMGAGDSADGDGDFSDGGDDGDDGNHRDAGSSSADDAAARVQPKAKMMQAPQPHRAENPAGPLNGPAPDAKDSQEHPQSFPGIPGLMLERHKPGKGPGDQHRNVPAAIAAAVGAAGVHTTPARQRKERPPALVPLQRQAAAAEEATAVSGGFGLSFLSALYEQPAASAHGARPLHPSSSSVSPAAPPFATKPATAAAAAKAGPLLEPLPRTNDPAPPPSQEDPRSDPTPAIDSESGSEASDTLDLPAPASDRALSPSVEETLGGLKRRSASDGLGWQSLSPDTLRLQQQQQQQQLTAKQDKAAHGPTEDVEPTRVIRGWLDSSDDEDDGGDEWGSSTRPAEAGDLLQGALARSRQLRREDSSLTGSEAARTGGTRDGDQHLIRKAAATFAGEAGQELAALQRRFGGDERFQLGPEFRDDYDLGAGCVASPSVPTDGGTVAKPSGDGLGGADTAADDNAPSGVHPFASPGPAKLSKPSRIKKNQPLGDDPDDDGFDPEAEARASRERLDRNRYRPGELDSALMVLDQVLWQNSSGGLDPEASPLEALDLDQEEMEDNPEIRAFVEEAREAARLAREARAKLGVIDANTGIATLLPRPSATASPAGEELQAPVARVSVQIHSKPKNMWKVPQRFDPVTAAAAAAPAPAKQQAPKSQQQPPKATSASRTEAAPPQWVGPQPPVKPASKKRDQPEPSPNASGATVSAAAAASGARPPAENSTVSSLNPSASVVGFTVPASRAVFLQSNLVQQLRDVDRPVGQVAFEFNFDLDDDVGGDSDGGGLSRDSQPQPAVDAIPGWKGAAKVFDSGAVSPATIWGASNPAARKAPVVSAPSGGAPAAYSQPPVSPESQPDQAERRRKLALQAFLDSGSPSPPSGSSPAKRQKLASADNWQLTQRLLQQEIRQQQQQQKSAADGFSALGLGRQAHPKRGGPSSRGSKRR